MEYEMNMPNGKEHYLSIQSSIYFGHYHAYNFQQKYVQYDDLTTHPVDLKTTWIRKQFYKFNKYLCIFILCDSSIKYKVIDIKRNIFHVLIFNFILISINVDFKCIQNYLTVVNALHMRNHRFTCFEMKLQRYANLSSIIMGCR